MNGQVCNDPQGTADTSEKDHVRIKLRSEKPWKRGWLACTNGCDV